jgi:hypothetical protein
MARSLQSLAAWEELAEDPFRGLRAGPATFSPFLFLAKKPSGKLHNSTKTSRTKSAHAEQNAKLLSVCVRPADFGFKSEFVAKVWQVECGWARRDA